MPEPEELILEGAHVATTFARDLWQRHASDKPDHVNLVGLHHRLELFNAAVFGQTPSLVTAEPPDNPTWLARLAKRIPSHLIERQAFAWTDGDKIRLPADLTFNTANQEQAYQLMAVGQAMRVARGSHQHVPADLLVRDLYLIAEAVAVNAAIAEQLHGFVSALISIQIALIADRPELKLLNETERQIERMIQHVLAADPHDPPLPVHATPAESLAWAQAQSQQFTVEKYRGLPLVPLWGRMLSAPLPIQAHHASTYAESDQPTQTTKTSMLRRRPKVRQAPDDEDDQQMGMWMVRIDAPEESVEDPMGLQRPTDRDDHASADDLADALAELPEARIVNTPGSSRELLLSGDPPDRMAEVAHPTQTYAGVSYPEWDYRIQAYKPQGVIVREISPMLGNAAWAEASLKRHARLVYQVRRHFERLRPQRKRLGRQTDGCEIDLTAYVDAVANRMARQSLDDRLYSQVRPARRPIAISLLLDVSASTDSWVSASLRIIDVEKEALLIVCEALDLLGDRYNILAFSGTSANNVIIQPIKAFSERTSGTVRRRIASLEPERYTRLGAAIRHSTALLAKEPAWNRLLLILSDGKPNDVDQYEGRYGIEDTRQAVAESRLQGITPFCLTVDRQAPSYMTRIYGSSSYAMLHHPERLPHVLVELIRRLLKS